MNIFIGILLLCALLGLWDKISGGKMGLAAEFDGGLASMASLALSIVGIYCIGVTACLLYTSAVWKNGKKVVEKDGKHEQYTENGGAVF